MRPTRASLIETRETVVVLMQESRIGISFTEELLNVCDAASMLLDIAELPEIIAASARIAVAALPNIRDESDILKNVQHMLLAARNIASDYERDRGRIDVLELKLTLLLKAIDYFRDAAHAEDKFSGTQGTTDARMQAEQLLDLAIAEAETEVIKT